MAEASRALVGNTSISEHYSFAGVAHVFEQHAGAAVSRLAFAHDERGRLGIAAADGALSLVNAEGQDVVLWLKGHTGSCISYPSKVPPETGRLGLDWTGPVSDFAWSTSNDLIASVSRDGAARVWDASSGECIRVMEEGAPLLSAAFQPLNNNHLVVGSAKGTLAVFNISTGKHIKSGTCRVGGSSDCDWRMEIGGWHGLGLR